MAILKAESCYCTTAHHCKPVNISFGQLNTCSNNLSTCILESVAELRVQVATLTTHDIDADSARGTSIITDDKSSCRFSDDEEVCE